MARIVAPVAGAVVGFYVGGPQGAQIGWMIGSLVGNAIDPMEVRGPSIGDLQLQTSRDGAPRPILFGTAACAGNVIYRSPPRYYETSESGKGGPEQITEHVALSFGIGFIDAWANDVAALTRLWEDEKLVVDLTPESQILAESRQYLSKLTIYLGRPDQMPDPTYEADKGVGNVPALRGTAWIMFTDIEVTQRRSIPNYRAEWTSATVSTQSGGGWAFGPASVNGILGGSQTGYMRADTLEELPTGTWVAAPHSFSKISKAANGTLFLYSHVEMSVSFNRGQTWTPCTGLSGPSWDSYEVTWNGHFYYHRTFRSADGISWAVAPNLPSGTKNLIGREYFNNPVVASQDTKVFISLDDCGTWVEHGGYSFIDSSSVTPGHLQFKFTHNSTIGYYTDDLFNSIEMEDGGYTFVMYRAYYSDDFSGTWMRKTYTQGILWSDDGGLNWEMTRDIPLGANQANSVAWGDHTWVAIRIQPASPSHRWYINYNREGGKPDDPVLGPRWHEIATPLYGNGGNIVYFGDPLLPTVTKGTTTVAEIVTKLLAYIGFDTTRLEFDAAGSEVVKGYIVGGLYSVVEAIRPLQQTHTFDFVAVDGKLKTVKRGGAPVFTLSDDDCIYEGEIEDDEEYMEDEMEYPKKLHLDYQNPFVGYASSKATVSRSSPDVRVKGEVSIMSPESFDSEEAHRIADVMLKMAWVDVKGEVRRKVPRKYAKAIPTNCVILQSRGRSLRLRIDDINREDGISEWIMRHDRQSAYIPSEHIVGAPLPEPTAPPSTIAGPTVFEIFNIPARIIDEDTVGYYVAGRGALPGWIGYHNQVSLDDGNSFVTESTHTTGTALGTLLESLAIHPSAFTDETNSILVDMPDGTTFSSITDSQLRNYLNALVISYPNGTAEYLQFRDAVHEGGTIWRLSHLIRGRLGTNSLTVHDPGSSVAVLASLAFIPVSPARIGVDTVHRPVSINDLAENTVLYDFTYSPAVNQIELAATYLTLNKVGTTLNGVWIPRYRLGSELSPVRSANQIGWRVVLVNGATTRTLDTVGASFSMDVSGLAGTSTVTVYAVNTFTGLGLPLSGSITL